jgi:hypothetical protein
MSKPEFYVEGGSLRTQEPLLLKSAEEALEISIRKWEFIVQKIERDKKAFYDGGAATCGLCRFFDACFRCPVGVKAGMTAYVDHSGCFYTPYQHWVGVYGPEDKLVAAKAELEFLVSLR